MLHFIKSFSLVSSCSPATADLPGTTWCQEHDGNFYTTPGMSTSNVEDIYCMIIDLLFTHDLILKCLSGKINTFSTC